MPTTVAPAASLSEGVEVKLSIFKKILQKRPSDENAMPVEKPSSASSSKGPSGCRIQGKLTFDLSVDDKELLATALGMEPTPSKDLEKPKKKKTGGPEWAKLSLHMMEECSIAECLVGIPHNIISFWALPGVSKKKMQARKQRKPSEGHLPDKFFLSRCIFCKTLYDMLENHAYGILKVDQEVKDRSQTRYFGWQEKKSGFEAWQLGQ